MQPWDFSKGLKAKFETAVVNELSVFDIEGLLHTVYITAVRVGRKTAKIGVWKFIPVLVYLSPVFLFNVDQSVDQIRDCISSCIPFNTQKCLQ